MWSNVTKELKGFFLFLFSFLFFPSKFFFLQYISVDQMLKEENTIYPGQR